MFIRKTEAKEKKVGDMTVWEYALNNPGLGIAVAHIQGRYPVEGESCNTECDEVYFVLGGTATVYVEHQPYEIAEGDALLLPKGKFYFVVAENLKILAPTAPAWFLEQQRKRISEN